MYYSHIILRQDTILDASYTRRSKDNGRFNSGGYNPTLSQNEKREETLLQGPVD